MSFINSNSYSRASTAVQVGYNGTATIIFTSADGGATWGPPYDVFSSKANGPELLAVTSHRNLTFLLLTSLEQDESGNFDGETVLIGGFLKLFDSLPIAESPVTCVVSLAAFPLQKRLFPVAALVARERRAYITSLGAQP